MRFCGHQGRLSPPAMVANDVRIFLQGFQSATSLYQVHRCDQPHSIPEYSTEQHPVRYACWQYFLSHSCETRTQLLALKATENLCMAPAMLLVAKQSAFLFTMLSQEYMHSNVDAYHRRDHLHEFVLQTAVRSYLPCSPFLFPLLLHCSQAGTHTCA